MFTELELNLLGFRAFDFLRKEDRDGLKRLSWSGLLENHLLTVRLINKSDEWQVDYLNIDNDEENNLKAKYFSNTNVIDTMKLIKMLPNCNI